MFSASPSNTSEVRSSTMHSSQSFCRLCAKQCELSSLLHIFSDNKIGTVSLDALLKRYLPFPVSANDSLSHYICKLCCGYVLRWHRFLTLCIKAQIQLKNVEEKSLFPNQDKLELNNPVEESVQVSKCLVPKLSSVNSRAADQLKLSSAKKRKSNYCIARWCNNSNDMGVPFFRVPKDHNRALQWLSAADRMDLASKDVAYLYRCYLCATHFSKEMFVNESGKALTRNAIPTVFMKPAYAKKIEEAISNSNIYPKALQGIRLKNILPKSVQQTQGISVQGPLPVPRIQESYTHILGMVPEPQQKPLQEVFFVRDPVSSHSNVHIISMSPLRNDVPETIQILEVQNPKDIVTEPPQVLNIVTDSESSCVYQDSAKDICSKTEHTDNIFVSEFIKSGEIHDGNCKDIDMNQMESPRCSLSQGTLMDFSPGDANMMLNPNEKPSNIIEKTAILENHVEEDLGLHELQSEDSLALPALPAFSSENPAFANQDMGFQSKESAKDSPSHCLGNIVGSQDFLLMHSSSTTIEDVHGFAQDKNLNLCGRDPIIPESVAGTTAGPGYGERCDAMAMMAEASVRAIECTSPSHGQIIEGLMDLDHFLESG